MLYLNILQAKPRLLKYQAFISLELFKASFLQQNMQISIIGKACFKSSRKYFEHMKHIS